MKILYVITKADVGGAQTHLIQIANHFAKKHQVYVAFGKDGPMIKRLDRKVKIISLKHLKGPIDIKEDICGVKELTSIIKRLQPDILHLHSSKAGTIGRIAYRLANLKTGYVIFTAHSWSFTKGVSFLKKLLYSSIERFVLKYTDKAICVSKYDKQLALDYHFDENKLITIHNSVAASKNNVLEKIKYKSKSIVKFVMVARFAYPKMHRDVIEGIKILSESTKRSFELTFIGDGESIDDCKTLVRKYGLEKWIKFKGNIENARNVLNQYDVFVLMSKHEGLPISIIEAMSEGLPIIASPVGGVRELVANNGLFIEDNTPQSLKKAMERFLNLDNIRKAALASYQKYEASFQENIMLEKLEKIYDSTEQQR